MTVHQRPPDEALPAALPTPPARGRWNWHRIAQVAWVVLAPIYVQILHQLHLPVEVAAVFFAALTFIVAMPYWVFGLLIFWRKSGEWIGLSVSLLLVIIGSIGLVGINATEQTPQLLQLLNNIFGNFVLGPAVVLFLFTFPTGSFAPRWSLQPSSSPYAIDFNESLIVVSIVVSMMQLRHWRRSAMKWTWINYVNTCWRWCRRPCSRRRSAYGCASRSAQLPHSRPARLPRKKPENVRRLQNTA